MLLFEVCSLTYGVCPARPLLDFPAIPRPGGRAALLPPFAPPAPWRPHKRECWALGARRSRRFEQLAHSSALMGIDFCFIDPSLLQRFTGPKPRWVFAIATTIIQWIMNAGRWPSPPRPGQTSAPLRPVPGHASPAVPASPSAPALMGLEF